MFINKKSIGGLRADRNESNAREVREVIEICSSKAADFTREDWFAGGFDFGAYQNLQNVIATRPNIMSGLYICIGCIHKETRNTIIWKWICTLHNQWLISLTKYLVQILAQRRSLSAEELWQAACLTRDLSGLHNLCATLINIFTLMFPVKSNTRGISNIVFSGVGINYTTWYFVSPNICMNTGSHKVTCV